MEEEGARSCFSAQTAELETEVDGDELRLGRGWDSSGAVHFGTFGFRLDYALSAAAGITPDTIVSFWVWQEFGGRID
jgi:hypothetical protein